MSKQGQHSSLSSLRRAMMLNVNEPETRGIALALQTMLDDLGKGEDRARGAMLGCTGLGWGGGRGGVDWAAVRMCGWGGLGAILGLCLRHQ